MAAYFLTMQIFFEKTAPYILAAAFSFCWWKFDISIPADKSVLGASLTLGAILTGFLATSKAILMTLDSPIMQRIRGTTYLDDLVSYLGQAIWLSFGFCIISLVGFFINATSYVYGFIWIFIGVASAGAFIRVTNIMLQIVKHPPK